MKKLSAIVMFLTSMLVLGQGIKFENDSFQNLLAKAKKENKLIFMDAYASWCGPCKKMDKMVFAEAEVGTTYNTLFINTKFDMEKGEGVAIAQKYGVKAYPTYLFIDGNGEVVSRATGYFEVPEFVKVAKDAVDPTKKLSFLKEKMNAGTKDPETLKSVMKAFAFSDAPLATKAAEKYFEIKKDKTLEQEDLQMLFTFTKNANSPLYQEVIRRKTELTKTIPEQQLSAMIKNYQLNTIMETAFNKETKVINDKVFITEATKLMSKDDATATLMSLKMKMAFRAKKYEEYEKLALDYYKDGSQPSFSSNELNEVAWNFYEQVKDTKSLSKAIQWAEMSVKKDSGYANMDTLAQLYGKIGDKKNAKIWAEKAIQEAEKEGEDAGSTKEFLRKLQ